MEIDTSLASHNETLQRKSVEILRCESNCRKLIDIYRNKIHTGSSLTRTLRTMLNAIPIWVKAKEHDHQSLCFERWVRRHHSISVIKL